MNRITSPHRYNRYLYPTVAGTNVFAADSVYDALRQSGRHLWWDADGNLSREYYRYSPSLGEEERMERRLCHTEEGLLQGYWQESGDRYRSETVAAWYAYDAGGRRALKLASERAAGSAQSVVELCAPVYYVSPLVTLTRTGYSKHYFEGGRRICTVIGGGFAHVNWDSITSDPMPVVGPHDDKLAKVLLMGAESTFNDCIEVRAYLSNTETLYKTMLKESERYVSHEPAFYYHTDHLGSTSRFTDDSGRVVQTLAYMPYGEDWVDVTTFQYDTSQIGFYQFNGKEKDPETDYLYYGARYYWPDAWNGWLSPDPLMYEFRQWRNEPSPCESPLAGNRRDLGFSPYNYCEWNPVIFVDPDGNSPIPPLGKLWKLYSQGNSRERKIINWDLRWYTAFPVFNNSETASNKAKEAYGQEGSKGGKTDAYRHAMWQALNTQDIGEKMTRKWSDAHEYNTPKDEINSDLIMDIHNNDVGIEIGLQNPDATLEELDGIIKERIENGGMLILDKSQRLMKSNGEPLSTNEIRKYDTARKIGKEITNNKNETTY